MDGIGLNIMEIFMNIDHNAPLRAKKEIQVAAPREQVWSLLTDIDRWPEWQPNVSSAKLEGDLAVGTTFRWKANELGIKSTIQELEHGRNIGWTGTSLGMKAIHLWTLKTHGNGTRIITEESLSG